MINLRMTLLVFCLLLPMAVPFEWIEGADCQNPKKPYDCGDGKTCGTRCNGVVECPSGFDEGDCSPSDCYHNNVSYCLPYGAYCVTKNQVCDGNSDCKVWDDDELPPFDERNCRKHKKQPCNFGDASFQCPENLKCAKRCDGHVECVHTKADEINCEEEECNDGAIPCGFSSRACIRPDMICDGNKDCQNGFDEENCRDWDYPNPPCKGKADFLCIRSTKCARRCDGNIECPGTRPHDELDCNVCKHGAIRCPNGPYCVRKGNEKYCKFFELK